MGKKNPAKPPVEPRRVEIGDTVLVVLKDRLGRLVQRPGIVTRTWHGEVTPSATVQLTAFPDAANDGLGTLVPVSSAHFDEAGELENSWSFRDPA